MDDDDKTAMAFAEQGARLTVAGWGAALIILLTLTRDSWLGRYLIESYTKNGVPPDFQKTVGGYVATASVGLMASAFFLIAEAKTRAQWAGLCVGLSFTVLCLLLVSLVLAGTGVAPF